MTSAKRGSTVFGETSERVRRSFGVPFSASIVFILMIEQATVPRRTEVRLQGGEGETELVVNSTVQGPPKNAIKIDVLLTDSDNRGS